MLEDRILAKAAITIALLSTTASAQTLIRDISTSPLVPLPAPLQEEAPLYLAETPRGVIFDGFRFGFGHEVWLTDGTPAGTTLLADILTGYRGSDPNSFFVLPSNDVVCGATTDAFGRDPWLITPNGPELLFDVPMGNRYSTTGGFTLVGGNLYFLVYDGASTNLWVSDGTPGNAQQLTTFTDCGVASALHALGSDLMFLCNNRVMSRWELWRSNGTPGGTTMVFSNPREQGASAFCTGFSVLGVVGNHLVFWGEDPATGTEPWATDGTSAGTTILQDIEPGTPGSEPLQPEARHGSLVGNRLVLVAKGNGTELWATDGTVAGTTNILAPSLSAGLLIGRLPGGDAVLSMREYVVTPTSVQHRQNLYRTDGTSTGTSFITKLPLSDEEAADLGALAGNVLMFPGNDTSGTTLWKTDGTALGTTQVADLWPGESAEPRRLASTGTHAVFTADDGIDGRQLWSSDGTTTQRIPLGPTQTNNDSDLRPAGTFRGLTYWWERKSSGLWESDGTTAGTTALPFTYPGFMPFVPEVDYVELDRGFVLSVNDVNGTELWISDGSGAGTRLLADIGGPAASSFPRQFVRMENRAFFVAADEDGRELWTSDGTSSGTYQVADIEPGAGGSWPTELFPWNGKLFFQAETSSHGRELWVSDGTSSGTNRVTDLNPGASSAFPQFSKFVLPPLKDVGFAGMDDYVYFTATNGLNGFELWRSDGTTSGTSYVYDSWVGWQNGSPFGMTELDGRIVYIATDAGGTALWSTDGTPPGTVRETTLPGTVTAPLRRLGDEALFWIDDGSNRSHLWKTDGTASGTTSLVTINAYGVEWQTPEWSQPGATRLLFNANDGVTGDELWVTDGTVGGTRIVRDIAPASGQPRYPLRSGNRIVFVANDGLVGAELHAIDLLEIDDYAASIHGSGCAGSQGIVPSIAISGEARTAGTFSVDLADARPLSTAAILIGVGQAEVPLGGCALWTVPLVSAPMPTDANGSASLPLLVSPTFAGAVLNFQWATLDHGGALLGSLSSSPGLEIVLGL